MNFFRDNSGKIIIACITAILVVLMALSSIGKPNAKIASDTVGIVFTPLQKAFHYVGNCFKYASDKNKYSDKNVRLKKQLAEANKKLSDYDKIVEENDKLRSMLEIKNKRKDFNLVAANVIATDTSNYKSTIKIGKGLSSGIKKNDAVITDEGLVGYVSSVGRKWAVITTITDTSCSVSALVSRIDEHCIIRGDMMLFDEKKCKMEYASDESVMSVGDKVVTSGSGGIYPEGITIGKISKIDNTGSGISMEAVIDPAVDFFDVEEVLVITGKSEADKNTDDKDEKSSDNEKSSNDEDTRSSENQ